MQMICNSFLGEVQPVLHSLSKYAIERRGFRIMDIIEHLVGRFDLYLGQSVLLAYAVAYLAGVLVSLTPCVYPVIPVTVACIGGHGETSGTRGLVLSLFFVLGLALTYTALGLFAAMTGKLFGTVQSSPWTQGFLGMLFVFMALAMLDVFQVSLEKYMPRGMTSLRRTGLFGSFAIGVTSGFILGPCTTPVLAVILGVAAARQDALFGGSLLFVFSLGMGSLLVLVGTFTGMLAGLPKSGAWMVVVKKISGVMMLAVGVYFLYSAVTF
jgi:cytochrome c-type biogenesis protein